MHPHLVGGVLLESEDDVSYHQDWPFLSVTSSKESRLEHFSILCPKLMDVAMFPLVGGETVKLVVIRLLPDRLLGQF